MGRSLYFCSVTCRIPNIWIPTRAKIRTPACWEFGQFYGHFNPNASTFAFSYSIGKYFCFRIRLFFSSEFGQPNALATEPKLPVWIPKLFGIRTLPVLHFSIFRLQNEDTNCHHTIPSEIAQKIVDKISLNQRFCAYIVIPMFPEGDPASAPIQVKYSLNLRWGAVG